MISPLKWLSWLVVAAAGASWAAARTAAPVAADPDRFFAGRTITYIVATGPGGGYDSYARLIGRHLERHLDGVRVVIRHVPGAAHLIGLDQINRAPADGLTLGTFSIGQLYLELAGQSAGRFALGAMSWVGKAAAEPRVLVVGSQTPFASIVDLQRADRRVTIATEGVMTSAHFASTIVTQALDIRARLIPGFTEDEAQLAMLRGEVDGVVASYTSLRATLAAGRARAVLQIGGRSLQEGVPTDSSLNLSPQNRALLSLVARQAEFGRVTAGPPGIPADRLAILRAAYAATLSDPLLIEEARRLRLPMDPLDGEALAVRLGETLRPPEHVLNFLRRLPGR